MFIPVNDQILEYIKQNDKVTPLSIVNALKVSESSVTKALASLVTSGKIIKSGQNRSTVYSLAPEVSAQAQVPVTEKAVEEKQTTQTPPPAPVENKTLKPDENIATLKEVANDGLDMFNAYEVKRWLGWIEFFNKTKPLVFQKGGWVALVLLIIFGAFIINWLVRSAINAYEYAFPYHHQSTRANEEIVQIRSESQLQLQKLSQQLNSTQEALEQTKEALAHSQNDAAQIAQDKQRLQDEFSQEKLKEQQEKGDLQLQLKASQNDLQSLKERLQDAQNQSKGFQEQSANASIEEQDLRRQLESERQKEMQLSEQLKQSQSAQQNVVAPVENKLVGWVKNNLMQ